MPMSFHPGCAVEARFGGGSKLYKGILQRDNGDGTWVVEYADGDREAGVKDELIRLDGTSRRWQQGLVRLRAKLHSLRVMLATLLAYLAAQTLMIFAIRDLGAQLLQLQLTFTAGAYMKIVQSWSSTQLTQYEEHFKVDFFFRRPYYYREWECLSE